MQADRELAAAGKTPEKLKGAGSFLMKVFGVLAVCFSSDIFITEIIIGYETMTYSIYNYDIFFKLRKKAYKL